MIEDIKHFRVNWIDGMKISKDHFIDIQKYIQEAVRDSMGIYLETHGYGILPKKNAVGIDIDINIDAHKGVKLSINALHALIPNGHRIEISSLTPPIQKELLLEDLSDFEVGYVMISVDANDIVPFGEVNEKEVPPRAPYLRDAYTFSVVKKEQLEKMGIPSNQLPIAKIINSSEIFSVSESYIPPCTSLNSHSSLLGFFNSAEGFLKNMEKYSINIVNKIKSSKYDNEIASATRILCEQIIQFLGKEVTMLKWQGKQMPPMYILNILVSLSRIMKNCMDSLDPGYKDPLLNYYGDWASMKVSEFETMFSRIINLNYVHYDIIESIVEIQKFMEVLGELFKIFTELDYIGKSKDMGIFVNENIVDENSGAKKK